MPKPCQGRHSWSRRPAPAICSWPIFRAHQFEGPPYLLACKEQYRLNYNRKTDTTHTKTLLEHLVQVLRETAPLGPRSTYYLKTNMCQVKEQEQTPEEELNEMEASTLSNTEFKTLVIRVLNKLRGE